MNIAIVGTGNMGKAILKGLLDNNFPKSNILALTKSSESKDKVSQEFGIKTSNDLSLIKDFDVIILGIKPQSMNEVLIELNKHINNNSLIISLAVGVTTKKIEETLNISQIKVVRAMPNTPALVGKGVTGIAKGTFAGEKELKIANDLLSNVGKVFEVDEKLIDVLAATSGSGPAYYFYVTENLIKAANELGLDKDLAKTLVENTFFGASQLLEQSAEDASELRKKVTSPKGTTLAALEELDKNNFAEIWKKALSAAIKRADEISKS